MSELMPKHRYFVTLEYFYRDMLGMTSKQWFYKHADDPGFPKRVMVGGKPMLVFDECLAYMERAMEARAKKPERKRHPGRPAKQFVRA